MLPLVCTMMSRWSCRFAPTPGRSWTKADLVLRQMAGGADAGKHKKLRRVDRAAADEHFALGDDCFFSQADLNLNAAGALAVEQDAPRHGAGDARQVWAAFHRAQIGGGGGGAAAFQRCGLIEADARLAAPLKSGLCGNCSWVPASTKTRDRRLGSGLSETGSGPDAP